MTLPQPCPKPDCKAPIAHWHNVFGDPEACTFAMRGEPCPDDDADHPCHAPRATAPLHLPDVDTVARAVRETCETWEKAGFNDLKLAPLPETIARAVLDLIAAHQPVWRDIDPADIKVGDRVRLVTAQGDESIYTVTWRDQDWINGHDETRDVRFPHTWYIDPATIPAPTLTERIRAALNDSPESRITLDVADVEALLDMVGGEDK